jgi:hypothetical protein
VYPIANKERFYVMSSLTLSSIRNYKGLTNIIGQSANKKKSLLSRLTHVTAGLVGIVETTMAVALTLFIGLGCLFTFCRNKVLNSCLKEFQILSSSLFLSVLNYFEKAIKGGS